MTQLPANLRKHRLQLNMTQEEVAQALNVAPQTVSKWERAETYPDVLMLPALAHLFRTSTDALLGMDAMQEMQRIGAVYTEARRHLSAQDWPAAISVYEKALRIWPADSGLLTDLAMALALTGERASQQRAAELCTRVLCSDASIKTQHTARAALCYIYRQLGENALAAETAHQLPHTRESREVVLDHLQSNPDESELHALLYELSTGQKP